MTNKEKVDILLKYFGTPLGNIDLSGIDFSDRVVDNGSQKAKIIYNSYQEANEIDNNNQVIKPNYETMSKEELIEEIKKLIKGEVE